MANAAEEAWKPLGLEKSGKLKRSKYRRGEGLGGRAARNLDRLALTVKQALSKTGRTTAT